MSYPGFHPSGRERQVLQLIIEGRTNAEIAGSLGISFATAKWHVAELISKAGVSSREELADHWRAEIGLRRRIRRTLAGLAGISPLKAASAMVATGLAGAAALLAVGFTASATPSSDSEVAVVATSTPLAPVAARIMTEQEAEVAARAIVESSLQRFHGQASRDLPLGGIHPVRVNGSLLGADDLVMTRLEFVSDATLAVYTSGGRSGVTPGDIWISEWRRDGLEVPEWGTANAVFTLEFAFDAVTGRHLGGGPGISNADAAPASSSALAEEARILLLAPAPGQSVPQHMTRPTPEFAAVGACATVATDHARGYGSFRMTLDGADVTAEMHGAPISDEIGKGKACFAPADGLAVGAHSATVEVVDEAGTVVETASWKFVITP